MSFLARALRSRTGSLQQLLASVQNGTGSPSACCAVGSCGHIDATCQPSTSAAAGSSGWGASQPLHSLLRPGYQARQFSGVVAGRTSLLGSLLHGSHKGGSACSGCAGLGGTSPLATALPSALPSPGRMAQLQQARGFQMIPRNFKFRKMHKGASFGRGSVPNTTQLNFGLYGIRSLEAGRLTAKQLEAVRRALRRKVKKTAKIWITVAPNIPVTSKPAEVRMGKGKGAVAYYAAPIQAGQILFEMDRVPRPLALQAMEYVAPKFPIKIGFVEWS